jgi:2-methylcitrate dehydratase PrpD
MTAALHRLARWGASLAYGELPAAVVEAAKTQLFSTLASVHAGYRSDLGKPIQDAFGIAGSGALALPAGIETGPEQASFLMAAWGIVLDFDDIMLGGHTGHSTALVPLAYAQAKRATGREVLLAQVTANEITARVNLTMALGSMRGQMASHVHLLGAAAARAKLENLDSSQFAESLGFALSQPPRALYPGFLGSDAKALCAAWPVRMGLESVDAVKAGLRGNASILDAPHGFIRTFAPTPVPACLDGLGERWHTTTNSIKPYPACGYLNAVLDATLSLVRKHDLDADAVASVEVRASMFTVGMDAHSAPYLDGGDSRISTLTFSTPYTVACAIIHRDLCPEHLRRDRITDARVWQLAKKVRVVHDMDHTIAALLADIPVGAAIKRAHGIGAWRMLLSLGGPKLAGKLLLRHPFGFVRLLEALHKAVGSEEAPDFSRSTKALGATVKLRTPRGEVFEETVAIPRGFAGSGDAKSSRSLAREKYCTQAAAVIGVKNALQAAALMDRLEELESGEVMQLLSLNCASHEGA